VIIKKRICFNFLGLIFIEWLSIARIWSYQGFSES
jgi:hypothetical protein